MHVLTLVLVLTLLPIPLAAEDAEDKLAQAELVEVSAGDLEKALAAYKALLSDEKTPAATRARALLRVARCQRKLGQLEAAKKTLEELLKNHAGEAETARQARSFLKEIQNGRAESSDFDWIREIEKNPEIQARVFEWTMSLASADEKAPSAAQQLLALGTIALPVVERVLDSSRDESHRQLLAMICVRAG